MSDKEYLTGDPVRGDIEGLSEGAIKEEAPASIPFKPAMLKNQALLLQRAQLAQIAGEPEQGSVLLESAIRAGGWKASKLWWGMVPLVSGVKDYRRIQNLWLSSPKACHSHPSVLRAVARAAVVTGHHDESRALLRKLIILVDSKARLYSAVASKASKKGERKFSSNAALALSDLNQAFSELGVRAFLISGTLLGKVRENGIIGWDKDIDVGYFSEECEVDLEACFMRHGKFRLGKVDLTSDRLRLIHVNGTWIDVFPHYLEGGKRWHDGTATRWWNMPFELDQTEFLGIKQYIPDNPELYLEENYGDWRKPNPFFDARIDAPNVEVTDPDHFLSLVYFGLESSIRGGKDEMRRRYIAILRERGEGAWLDRVSC